MCEKVHIVAGPEFGEDEGKVMIVERGCHGLETSAIKSHGLQTKQSRF